MDLTNIIENVLMKVKEVIRRFVLNYTPFGYKRYDNVSNMFQNVDDVECLKDFEWKNDEDVSKMFQNGDVECLKDFEWKGNDEDIIRLNVTTDFHLEEELDFK